jgi:hypothetical protein
MMWQCNRERLTAARAYAKLAPFELGRRELHHVHRVVQLKPMNPLREWRFKTVAQNTMNAQHHGRRLRLRLLNV